MGGGTWSQTHGLRLAVTPRKFVICFITTDLAAERAPSAPQRGYAHSSAPSLLHDGWYRRQHHARAAQPAHGRPTDVALPSEGINGAVRLDCRAPCCIIPAITPEGDDTPKHMVAAAQHVAAMEGIPQLSFGNVETETEANFMSPPKSIFTHDRETGMTPCQGYNARMNALHPGVPATVRSLPSTLQRPLGSRSEEAALGRAELQLYGWMPARPVGPGLVLIHLVGLTNGSPTAVAAAVAAAGEWVLAVERMWGLTRAV